MRKMAVALAALSVVVALSLGMTACGGGEASEPTKEEAAQQKEGAAAKNAAEDEKKTQEEEAAAVVYPDNKQIDAFARAWNSVFPDMAFTAESLVPYYHHGSIHEDQVNTSINGMAVTITSEGFSRPYNVSIYYASYASSAHDDLDAAAANRELFGYVMRVVCPSLSEEDIQARWQEVMGNGYAGGAKWDDGTRVEVSPTAKNEGDGSYSYVKFYV